jgi:RimJ/RimL family protein N-acetyltransferase
LCQQEYPPLNFAIEYNYKFCGVIGLVPLQDVYSKSAEMGYWIGEPFWGMGLVVKSIKLIVQYAFNEVGFIRLNSSVFAYNTASMRVLEKSSFTKECIAKNAVVKNGIICDEHRYVLLKSAKNRNTGN